MNVLFSENLQEEQQKRGTGVKSCPKSRQAVSSLVEELAASPRQSWWCVSRGGKLSSVTVKFWNCLLLDTMSCADQPPSMWRDRRLAESSCLSAGGECSRAGGTKSDREFRCHCICVMILSWTASSTLGTLVWHSKVSVIAWCNSYR